MDRYLKELDIFEVEKGMKVYALIPEKYIYANTPYSDRLEETDIIVGKVYKNNTDSETKWQLIRDIQEEASSCGINIPKADVEEFILKYIDKSMSQQSCFDSSYLEGKYLVTHTEFSGGGGIAMFHDEYPDGYLVRAKKLVNGMPGDLEIRFYQSGSFTAMIYPEDIKLCN